MSQKEIRRLIRRFGLLIDVYFRYFEYCVGSQSGDGQGAPMYLSQKELRALGVKTVGDMRAEWQEAVSLVLWDQKKYGQPGKLYRLDLRSDRSEEELRTIPAKAEVDQVKLKPDPEAIPELLLYEPLQSCALALERSLPAKMLTMVQWPWLPLFQQCISGDDLMRYAQSRSLSATQLCDELKRKKREYHGRLALIKRMYDNLFTDENLGFDITGESHQANSSEKPSSEAMTPEVPSLTKAQQLAYASYQYAIDHNPALADATDREVYQWLKEYGYEGQENYRLPSFETWKRYVGAGRQFHGTQKNTRRAGRKTRAPKAADDPALLRQISNRFQKRG